MPIYSLEDMNRTWKDDAVDIALLLLGVLLIILFVFVGVLFSDWLARAFYRAGFHSTPTEWIAHFTGFGITLVVIFTLAGRVFDGRFWWR